ncbi:MAG: flagellar export chaperone FliS [Acidobacteria bacterium]|nr:MAG: flagellar export chaperone FliS [Acidobacteriota bacterium]
MNAASAYQRRAIEGATPVGLVVLLYQGAVVQLRRAIAAMETQPQTVRDIEIRTSALNRVLAIIGELQRVLDFQRGGDIARNFDHFYRLAQSAIMQAVANNDAQPLRDLLPQLEKILQAWRSVETRPPAPSAGAAAWTA